MKLINKKTMKKLMEKTPRFLSHHFLYRDYEKVRKQLYLPPEQLKVLQEKKLDRILKIAKSLDYYHTLDFSRPSSHLNDFPILKKKDLILNHNKLINKKHKLTVPISTSGSTGEPFRFVRNVFEEKVEYLYVLRHFDRFGYKPGDPIAALRSYIPSHEEAPKAHWTPLQNIYWFSAYHMTEKYLAQYCSLLKEKQLHYLLAYPSSAYILADYCLTHKIELPDLKAILVSSEKTLPQWFEIIRKAFPQAELIDRYGTAEFSSSLTFCSQCQGFHVNEDYGVTELIPIDQNRFYIVSTGFLNSAFPMIRYNTEDIFVLKESLASQCSYGSRVIRGEIEGRSTDLIFTGDKYLPGVNFYTLFYYHSDVIKQFQIQQSSKDQILVLLVPQHDSKDLTMKLPLIEADLKKRVGPLKIEFKLTQSIERDLKTGKVKNIVSTLTS